MFYHVRGKLIHVEEGMAAVECAGVAFALKTTNNTLSKLPALQSEVTLYTYFLVREGAMELYGFYDQGELNCFQMLLTVSGVGPKAALAILSHLSPEKFALCVATGDVKSITRAQGVGPKLAQRLILELKDKVQKELGVQMGPRGGMMGGYGPMHNGMMGGYGHGMGGNHHMRGWNLSLIHI